MPTFVLVSWFCILEVGDQTTGTQVNAVGSAWHPRWSNQINRKQRGWVGMAPALMHHRAFRGRFGLVPPIPYHNDLNFW